MAAIQKVLKLLFGVGGKLRRIIPVTLHMPLTGACICAPHPSLYAEAPPGRNGRSFCGLNVVMNFRRDYRDNSRSAGKHDNGVGAGVGVVEAGISFVNSPGRLDVDVSARAAGGQSPDPASPSLFRRKE